MSGHLCIIPARGGSIRLPGKNMLAFEGEIMLSRAINLARESTLFSEIVVSTDDDLTAKAAEAMGASVHFRIIPDDGSEGTQSLARRVAVTAGVHRSLDRRVCVIYPCTPLLFPVDLQLALESMDENGHDFALAVGADPLRDAGAFYWSCADALICEQPLLGSRTTMYVLPEARCCDINTAEDLNEAVCKYRALEEGGRTT